jgi:predicted transcriptional regulator
MRSSTYQELFLDMEAGLVSSKSIDDLGQLQRAVMEVVWRLGQASVHQVREQLAQKKELAYTTVLTAMQKLEKAGLLRHRAQGKSYVYLPTRSREEAGAKSALKFIKRVFDGDAVLMFQHLIRESDLSNQELTELRKMISQKRKEMKNDS